MPVPAAASGRLKTAATSRCTPVKPSSPTSAAPPPPPRIASAPPAKPAAGACTPTGAALRGASRRGPGDVVCASLDSARPQANMEPDSRARAVASGMQSAAVRAPPGSAGPLKGPGRRRAPATHAPQHARHMERGRAASRAAPHRAGRAAAPPAPPAPPLVRCACWKMHFSRWYVTCAQPGAQCPAAARARPVGCGRSACTILAASRHSTPAGRRALSGLGAEHSLAAAGALPAETRTDRRALACRGGTTSVGRRHRGARLVEVRDRLDLEGLHTLLVVKVADLAVDAHVHAHAPLGRLPGSHN